MYPYIDYSVAGCYQVRVIIIRIQSSSMLKLRHCHCRNEADGSKRNTAALGLVRVLILALGPWPRRPGPATDWPNGSSRRNGQRIAMPPFAYGISPRGKKNSMDPALWLPRPEPRDLAPAPRACGQCLSPGARVKHDGKKGTLEAEHRASLPLSIGLQ